MLNFKEKKFYLMILILPIQQINYVAVSNGIAS